MTTHDIDRDVRFYTAHATHSRAGLSQPSSTFAGHLGIVRAPLPDRGEGAAVVHTSRGTLEIGDRLLPTLDHVRAFCAMHGAPSPARVEVLAPPRVNGHRFAPMSVYLLYPSARADHPSHFVLEAGMATGESSICYPPCPVGSWQTVRAGYRPTPFSTREQLFRGTFETDPSDPDEPGRLVVEAYRAPTDSAPALRVTVQYEADAAAASHPLLLRVTAGIRLAAVAEAMGRPFALAARLLVRLAGSLLPWIDSPRAESRRLPAGADAVRVSHP